jgi:hypothetical protein
MVTRRKRWSTSAGSGWPQGRSLVVQVSGGALARTSSVNPSIKIKSNFRGNRVDTIFRAGRKPCSFFVFHLPRPMRPTRWYQPIRSSIAFSTPPGVAKIQRNWSIVACSGLGTSIDGRGIIQIGASLDCSFLAANLQLESIRASETRRGHVCEISTLPERDRAMLRGFQQIQSFEDRVATGTKTARARRSCSGRD